MGPGHVPTHNQAHADPQNDPPGLILTWIVKDEKPHPGLHRVNSADSCCVWPQVWTGPLGQSSLVTQPLQGPSVGADTWESHWLAPHSECPASVHAHKPHLHGSHVA